MSQAVVPSMRRNKYGRIVNVSSDLGSMTSMGGGYPSYRIAKAALNALTQVLASELSGTNIKVNSLSPGWVRTDMGGAGAPRPVEQGADTAVWLATLPRMRALQADTSETRNRLIGSGGAAELAGVSSDQPQLLHHRAKFFG